MPRAENKLPIFTLSILTKQVHIINSPDLVVAVQKNPKVYDFSVFAIAMLPRLFDLDSKTMRLASTQIDHPGGSWNLVVETSRIMHRCLAPGPSLESMERLALTKMLRYFDELGNKPGDTVLELFAWLRTVMTIASTEAVSSLIHTPPRQFADSADCTSRSMARRIPSARRLSWSMRYGKCPMPRCISHRLNTLYLITSLCKVWPFKDQWLIYFG